MFLVSLLLTATFAHAATDIDGYYFKPHTIGYVGSSCETQNDDDEMPTTEVSDSVLIKKVSDKEYKVSMMSMGTNFHSCSAEGSAIKKNDKYVLNIPSDSDPKQNCRFEFTVNPDGFSYKVSGDSCSQLCGARHSWDDDTYKLKERALSPDIVKSDFTKLTVAQANNLKEYLKYEDPNSTLSTEKIAELKKLAEDFKNKAQGKYKAKKYKEAKEYLSAAVGIGEEFNNITPQELAAWTNDLGFYYEKVNELYLAKNSYEKAIKLDQTRAVAYLNLADLIYSENEKKKEDTCSQLDISTDEAYLLIESNYEAYAKLNQKDLSKKVKDRCNLCAVYPKFLKDKKTDSKLAGTWKLKEISCEKGSATPALQTMIKGFNTDEKKATYFETYTIDKDNQTTFLQKIESTYGETTEQLYVNGSEMLVIRPKPSQIYNSEEAYKSKKPTRYDANVDTLRKYVLTSSDSLKLTTIDSKTSEFYCGKDGVLSRVYSK